MSCVGIKRWPYSEPLRKWASDRGSIRFIAAAFTLALIFVLPAAVDAQTPDFPVPGGRFFTQAATDTNDPRDGFAVVDDEDAEFWAAFETYGGVQGVGYPISSRFTWDGFVTQVMQKAVFQWRPESNSVAFLNVFDDLNRSGFDGRLVDLLVPEYENFEETGLDFGEIYARRTALLNVEPSLRAAFDAVDNPLLFFGLPTSRVVEYDGLRAIRLQRSVLQIWTSDFPWASAGTVTIANGGDLAKQLGLFPASALIPEAPPQADQIAITPENIAAPLLGASADESIPAGQALLGSDGSRVLVTGFSNDAWPEIIAADRYPSRPTSGNRFVLASVLVGYPSNLQGSIVINTSDFELVGSDQVIYGPGCGSNSYSSRISAELFPGGSAEGNICFEVPEEESDLLLIYKPSYSAESRRFMQTESNTAAITPENIAAPLLGASADESIPAGQALLGSDGSRVLVTGFSNDAWPEIIAADRYPSRPTSGNRFVLASVLVGYPSNLQGSIVVNTSDFELVGSDQVIYGPGCGSNSYSSRISAELFPGGSAEGNICFEVPEEESDLLLIYKPSYSAESRRYLEVA